MKKSLLSLLLAVLMLLQAGCANQPTSQTQPGHLTTVVTQDTIKQLEDYPDLKSVDLSGSICFDAILEYMDAHPEVAVTYTVPLGTVAPKNTDETVTLSADSFAFVVLMGNLKYLPNVKILNLPATELTMEQIVELCVAYPQVQVRYTVELQGQEISKSATSLDLSWLTAQDISATIEKIKLLPAVTQVTLPETLALEDKQAMQAALPNISFQYSFQIFDKTVSTSDEALALENVTIDAASEESFFQALAQMPNLKTLTLTDCTLAEGLTDRIRAKFPGLTVEDTPTQPPVTQPPETQPPVTQPPVDPNPGPSGPTFTPPDGTEKVAITVTADTLLSEIAKYPQLKEVTFTGSCYAEIVAYRDANPRVKVNYTVSLGGSSTTVAHSTTTLKLEAGAYDYATLKANLRYLTKVRAVTFPATSLTAAQLDELQAAYPNVKFYYTMATQGTQLDASLTSVDLSAQTYDQVSQVSQYPNIRYVELMDANGTSKLTMAEVKQLQDANPNVIFHYTFTLGGNKVSTTSERIIFEGLSLNDIGETNLRNALDILDSCTYFRLDNPSSIDNAVMADLRDAYGPDIKVVWRIHHYYSGTGTTHRSWLTDTEVLRAVYHVDDSNSGVFKYLTDVRFMDLGHDVSMRDLSFLAYMPNLEICILSGSEISDLSPIAACKKLEFLEIAWCGWVTDISPLAQCDSLRYLNLGHTSVKDLSPLDGLDLEMLSFVNSGNKVGFDGDDWNAFQAKHPNCWITWKPLYDSEATPYSKGWRYKATSGYTYIYRRARDVFGYDNM